MSTVCIHIKLQLIQIDKKKLSKRKNYEKKKRNTVKMKHWFKKNVESFFDLLDHPLNAFKLATTQFLNLRMLPGTGVF